MTGNKQNASPFHSLPPSTHRTRTESLRHILYSSELQVKSKMEKTHNFY